MGHRFTNQLDRPIGDMKEEIKVATTARQHLEQRIFNLEQSSPKRTTPQRMLATKVRLTKQ